MVVYRGEIAKHNASLFKYYGLTTGSLKAVL